MWNTGQSRSGGGGNMPGAIRIFHIDKEANCTTELVESGVNAPRVTALRDAKGNVTASAFGSTCKVDALSALIDGKASPMERRTSWLWTLGKKSDAGTSWQYTSRGVTIKLANPNNTFEGGIWLKYNILCYYKLFVSLNIWKLAEGRSFLLFTAEFPVPGT